MGRKLTKGEKNECKRVADAYVARARAALRTRGRGPVRRPAGRTRRPPPAPTRSRRRRPRNGPPARATSGGRKLQGGRSARAASASAAAAAWTAAAAAQLRSRETSYDSEA